MRFLTLWLLVCLASPAWTAAKNVNARVTQTVVTDGSKFGGCMAKLNVRPAEKGLSCKSTWVTFSCSGDLTTKDAAIRMFDLAQIAQITERDITVQVTDNKKHNGYCFATRVYLK